MKLLPRASWLGTTIVFFALAMAGCAGDDGSPGRDGVDGQDGQDGADGGGGGGVARDVPTLQGHIPMFPEDNFHGNGITGLDDDRILPYDVQAAFNGDTFFWRVSYRGNGKAAIAAMRRPPWMAMCSKATRPSTRPSTSSVRRSWLMTRVLPSTSITSANSAAS